MFCCNYNLLSDFLIHLHAVEPQISPPPEQQKSVWLPLVTWFHQAHARAAFPLVVSLKSIPRIVPSPNIQLLITRQIQLLWYNQCVIKIFLFHF